MNAKSVERWIRVAAALVGAGLLVEIATAFWSHPTSFLFFLLGGGTLIVAGIIVYLLGLLRFSSPPA